MTNRIRTWFYFSLLISLAALGSPVTAEEIALPSTVSIVNPSPDVPKDISRFSGVWTGGAWNAILPHALIVENVSSDGSAVVVYATGDGPEWKAKPTWIRTTGKIENSQLVIFLQDGKARALYQLEGESGLIGSFETERGASYIELEKTNASSASDISSLTKNQKTTLVPETIFIPIKTRGFFGSTKELKLEATLYRPSRNGKFPIVFFNHGSTGRGAIPVSLTLRPQASGYYFAKRSYAVISPMRKGRGASQGRYNEPEICDSSSISYGVASAIEDLDGVFEYMLAQPYVDTNNILITGGSRGGYLSVIYSAKGKYRDKIKGVINFVGGWVGEGCNIGGIDHNSIAFYEAGKLTSLPMLWLYGERDSYYSPKAINAYFKAFTEAGGRAEFRIFGDIPVDGHRLTAFVVKWKKDVDSYLEGINFGK